jgi:hypothetical protein
MAKIQIKRYNGSTTSWENQFPVTKAQHIVATSDGTTAVFDSNDKIKPAYLPDAVFDSLYFFSTIAGAPISLASLAANAFPNASSLGRSALGYYWVATGSTGVTASTPTAVQIGSDFYTTLIQPNEEGISASTSGTTLETGDWIIITKITGAGTSGSPYAVMFAVVNNTYELATSSVDGIVRLSSETTYANLAGNNVVTDAVLKSVIDNANFAGSSHTHLLAAGATDVTATASEVNILDGATITTTELNYLDGVTSAIQTQLNGKAATSHTHTVANITDLTATATELNYVDGVTSAIQTQLNAKAPTANPTFTGTVVLPSTTSIGTISNTELSYLDGVTSAIQTQLNGKQATITGGATTIVSSNLTASRALVSDASGKVAVSAVTSTELGYLDGVTSAIQTQLTNLANRVRVYYDGTPSGMVTNDIWFDAI